MIGAIVKNDIVTGLMVVNEAQVEEMAAALSCEIVDAKPYGLIEGDLRTARLDAQRRRRTGCAGAAGRG